MVNIIIAVALHLAGLSKDEVAYGWAVGALMGSAAQFLIQWPGLRREGFSFRPDFDFKDPLLRDILTTMAPATIALAAVQINIFISSNYASTLPSAVTWLNFAFRLLYLPMGLFGVAVGTIAGARLSRLIASGHEGDAHAQMAQALRLLLFLTLPSALGLICAGGPIVRLIYEHGAFKAADTEAVAKALAWMSMGLVAYASTKVFVSYFYAMRKPRVPLAASLLAVGASLVVFLLLVRIDQLDGFFRGLLKATSYFKPVMALIAASPLFFSLLIGYGYMDRAMKRRAREAAAAAARANG